MSVNRDRACYMHMASTFSLKKICKIFHILIISKNFRHMHGALNIDEIKTNYTDHL
jgi:hypothetical protein